MKANLVLLIGSLLLASASVHAEELISTMDIADLPTLSDVKVVIVPGPSMATVQPMGFVEFSFSSCGKMPFRAEVIEEGSVQIVRVVLPSNAAECGGPAVERQYSLQISSAMSFFGSRTTVLNPVSAVTKQKE